MSEPITATIENKRVIVRAILDKWGTAMQYIANKNGEAEDYKALLKSLSDEPDEIRNSASVSSWEGMPHGGEISNPTERIALGLSGLRHTYDKQIELLNDDITERIRIKCIVDELLDKLPREQRTVICTMYRDRKDRPPTWDKIGEAMGYSEQRVRAFELAAVDNLSESVIISKSQAEKSR